MITLLLLLNVASAAESTWFCEEGASEKRDRIITSCGVDSDPTEGGARKKALAAAFDELDTLCERSLDCKTHELEIEPLRNDCRKESSVYKCYRAVRATITTTARKSAFVKGSSLAPARDKMDVVVRIDPSDLAALKAAGVSADAGIKNPRCKEDLAPLGQALLDISSRDKQDAMVREAIKIPFEPGCAEIHYKVLGILSRAKLEFADYTAFLIRTLDGLSDPSADDRAYWVLDYFHELGPLDERMWKAAFATLKKTPTHSLYRLMPRGFSDTATTDTQQKAEKARVDQFVEAVRKQEVGKPLPLKMDDSMELLLRSLRTYRTRARPWLAVYAYEKHRGSLTLETPHKILKSLISLWGDADEPATQTQVNEWIADLVKKATPSREMSRPLVDYIQGFESAIKKCDDEEDAGIKRISALRAMRAALLSRAGAEIGKNLAINRDDYERKANMMICVEHQIPCADLVPDLDRLAKLLTSKKTQKRMEALDVLAKQPQGSKLAAKLEKEIIACIEEADGGKLEGYNTREVIEQSMRALATIPTRDPRALKLLSDLHLQSRLSFQNVREQLGPGVEPYLVKALQERRVGVNQIAVLMELEEYKKLSSATCKYLRTLNGPKAEYYIKDHAEKALRRCD